MIEVLKQARKAFELATTPLAKDRQEVLEAVAAINQAIAELESQDGACQHCAGKGCVACDAREQEPVGEVDAIGLNDTDFHVSFKRPMPLGTKLYTHPPQRTEQEHEALQRIAEKLRRAGANLPAPQIQGTIESCIVTGLSIALANVETEIETLAKPLQRTWVGLDHHDKKKFSSWLDHKSDDEVFTAIEAKLNELNT